MIEPYPPAENLLAELVALHAGAPVCAHEDVQLRSLLPGGGGSGGQRYVRPTIFKRAMLDQHACTTTRGPDWRHVHAVIPQAYSMFSPVGPASLKLAASGEERVLASAEKKTMSREKPCIQLVAATDADCGVAALSSATYGSVHELESDDWLSSVGKVTRFGFAQIGTSAKVLVGAAVSCQQPSWCKAYTAGVASIRNAAAHCPQNISHMRLLTGPPRPPPLCVCTPALCAPLPVHPLLRTNPPVFSWP